MDELENIKHRTEVFDKKSVENDEVQRLTTQFTALAAAWRASWVDFDGSSGDGVGITVLARPPSADNRCYRHTPEDEHQQHATSPFEQ